MLTRYSKPSTAQKAFQLVSQHYSTAAAAPQAAAKPATPPPPAFEKKVFGGLKDQDRIFTNLYGDQDYRIKGALKRV